MSIFFNQNKYLFWGIQFDNISMNNEKIKDSNTVFFSYEFGLISATKMSEEIIAKNLFNLNNNNNKNCFMEEFTINEELFGEVKYNSYYCDLSANISNFPPLEFYNKAINVVKFSNIYNKIDLVKILLNRTSCLIKLTQ